LADLFDFDLEVNQAINQCDDMMVHESANGRVSVAQEVRAVVWQLEGCWFDPRAPPPS